ncbi:acetylornithine deacetylase/succinyl-diaminopimelate desuccinylase-like protein [Friedmanniella endophytica]|uniref:Acetylornithine deacetylase/succinyl-diaminopimelate desuccinylase-like protein n=1 Tax=Microlunatus kandeliicorticis TaxID=1759536 RepID=A0A7W3INQ2_9ACTN|nr:dipeptidase [Microlunatus kandeliicorticis]MBA8792439.1 acetylornithine deacetylase/succinyl-diaminopimelate desuccinylase-like protein [Microlunatus kandeliicorticis]
MTSSTVTEAVETVLPGVVADLERLVAIPSVSADPARADDVRRSAEAVAGLLRDTGCPDVRVVAAEGGQPAVIARYPAPAGMPTVCLYAHHDVQPTGDRALWGSDPFTADRRGDRLFGRGIADDKGGLAVHLAALRAFDGKPPVGVTLFIEGEEEIGSPTLRTLIDEHRDLLAADVYVIADSGNWEVGTPAFTTTLRGLAEVYVELRTLDHALHSGQYGGVAPDALTAMCRLLACLHDDRGNVAVPGLHAEPGPDLVYPPERLAAESGVLDGVDYLGEGSVVERLWTKPAIAVIALDATPVAQASNTLVAAARAKISIRLAPGDDATRATAAVIDHLRAHVPWGAQLTATPGENGEPSRIPFEGPYAEAARGAFAQAWGVEPVFVGQGGSIPMVADFQQRFPDATVLVTAVCDPDSRMHGADESLHLGDFGRACRSEALFLAACAEVTNG